MPLLQWLAWDHHPVVAKDQEGWRSARDLVRTAVHGGPFFSAVPAERVAKSFSNEADSMSDPKAAAKSPNWLRFRVSGAAVTTLVDCAGHSSDEWGH